MRPLLWVSLLAGSLTACSGDWSLDPVNLKGDDPATGAASQVYTPLAPGAATDVVIQLSWQPNADPVAGYRVYFGTSESNATNMLSDISTANRALNSQAPSVTYNAGRDLGLDPGNQACFRLRAYNSTGTLSAWSQADCTTI